MAPQRRRAITAIFHTALTKQGSERDAFLDHACKVDPSLRADVDAMIADHEAALSFHPEPAHPINGHSHALNEDEFPSERLAAAPSPAPPRAPAPATSAPKVPAPAAAAHHRELRPLAQTLAWMVIATAIIVIVVASWTLWFRH